jgi:STE24 endopeptidase
MTTLDPEKQKQAREYSRIKRRLWLADTLFSAAYALAWLFLGWSISVRRWLTEITTNDWLLVALYIFVFGGIYAALSLPLGYYSGFILPHRYGLSNQSL